jgi:hypothetical protein
MPADAMEIRSGNPGNIEVPLPLPTNHMGIIDVVDVTAGQSPEALAAFLSNQRTVTFLRLSAVIKKLLTSSSRNLY